MELETLQPGQAPYGQTPYGVDKSLAGSLSQIGPNVRPKGQLVLPIARPRGRRLSDHLESCITMTMNQLTATDQWEEDEVPPSPQVTQQVEQWLRTFYRELVVPTKDIALLPRFSLSGSGDFKFYWTTTHVTGIIQRTRPPNRFTTTIRNRATGRKESKELELDVTKPWSEGWGWLRQRLRK